MTRLISFPSVFSKVTLTFTAVLLTTSAAFSATEQVGINAAVKGNVTIQSGAAQAQQAEIKAPVFLGDEVNSKKKSALQVLLKDQSVFTVGPQCALTIDKFVYDPAKNNNQISANVKQGMFRFMSGKVSKSNPNNVSVDTPVASMGIRGTIVEGLVGADAVAYAVDAGIITAGTPVDLSGATLVILRGPGKANSGNDRRGMISVTSGGRTVDLRNAGMGAFVPDANTAPIVIKQIPAEIFEKFSSLLRTRPTAGGTYKPFSFDSGYIAGNAPSVPHETGDDENPLIDLDWPSDPGDLFEAGEFACYPGNPNYPACDVMDDMTDENTEELIDDNGS